MLYGPLASSVQFPQSNGVKTTMSVTALLQLQMRSRAARPAGGAYVMLIERACT